MSLRGRLTGCCCASNAGWTETSLHSGTSLALRVRTCVSDSKGGGGGGTPLAPPPHLLITCSCYHSRPHANICSMASGCGRIMGGRHCSGLFTLRMTDLSCNGWCCAGTHHRVRAVPDLRPQVGEELLLATFLGVLRRAQPPSCLGSEWVGLPRRPPPALCPPSACSLHARSSLLCVSVE